MGVQGSIAPSLTPTHFFKSDCPFLHVKLSMEGTHALFFHVLAFQLRPYQQHSCTLYLLLPKLIGNVFCQEFGFK